MTASLWIGCAPGNFRNGRAGNVPQAIVIHIMQGTLNGTRSHFWNPASKVSAHYGIGKNGEIHQYVRESDTAFHAGTIVNPTWSGLRKTPQGDHINPNYYTIGLEHEGFANETWPDAQYAASAALIAEIGARWGIRLDSNHIAFHREIRANKSCPGHTVQLDRLLQLIGGAPPPLARPVAPAVSVRAVVNLRVREKQPTTLSPVVRLIPAGTEVRVQGFTPIGEQVRGNACWYSDSNGDFFWAGGTNHPHPA